jgi:hypothetical protein
MVCASPQGGLSSRVAICRYFHRWLLWVTIWICSFNAAWLVLRTLVLTHFAPAVFGRTRKPRVSLHQFTPNLLLPITGSRAQLGINTCVNTVIIGPVQLIKDDGGAPRCSKPARMDIAVLPLHDHRISLIVRALRVYFHTERAYSMWW